MVCWVWWKLREGLEGLMEHCKMLKTNLNHILKRDHFSFKTIHFTLSISSFHAYMKFIIFSPQTNILAQTFWECIIFCHKWTVSHQNRTFSQFNLKCLHRQIFSSQAVEQVPVTNIRYDFMYWKSMEKSKRWMLHLDHKHYPWQHCNCQTLPKLSQVELSSQPLSVVGSKLD